jgi:hypothetical protein
MAVRPSMSMLSVGRASATRQSGSKPTSPGKEPSRYEGEALMYSGTQKFFSSISPSGGTWNSGDASWVPLSRPLGWRFGSSAWRETRPRVVPRCYSRRCDADWRSGEQEWHGKLPRMRFDGRLMQQCSLKVSYFIFCVCVMRLLYLGTSGYRPLTTHIERLTEKGSRMPASLDRRSGRWLGSVSVRSQTRLPQDTWQGQRPQTNEQRGEQ